MFLLIFKIFYNFLRRDYRPPRGYFVVYIGKGRATMLLTPAPLKMENQFQNKQNI